MDLFHLREQGASRTTMIYYRSRLGRAWCVEEGFWPRIPPRRLEGPAGRAMIARFRSPEIRASGPESGTGRPSLLRQPHLKSPLGYTLKAKFTDS